MRVGGDDQRIDLGRARLDPAYWHRLDWSDLFSAVIEDATDCDTCPFRDGQGHLDRVPPCTNKRDAAEPSIDTGPKRRLDRSLALFMPALHALVGSPDDHGLARWARGTLAPTRESPGVANLSDGFLFATPDAP